MTLRLELVVLLRDASRRDTPHDKMLADYLSRCLIAFDQQTKKPIIIDNEATNGRVSTI